MASKPNRFAADILVMISTLRSGSSSNSPAVPNVPEVEVGAMLAKGKTTKAKQK